MGGEAWAKLKNRKNGTSKYDKMAAKDKMRCEKEKRAYEVIKATRLATEEQEREIQFLKDKEEAMKLVEQQQKETEQVEPMEDTAQKSKGKTKRVKDPDAPKRATSSYIFFCQEKRTTLTEENPGKTPTEVTK